MISTHKHIVWNDQELQAMFARLLPRVPIPSTLAQQLSDRVLKEVAHYGKREHFMSTEESLKPGILPDSALSKNVHSSVDHFAHK